MRISLVLTALVVLVTFIPDSFAKRFTNKYSEFELPIGWECELEASEWVCQSTNADRKKEAIIILAAKVRGEQDDIDQYQAYLKAPKTYTLPGGKKQVSEAKYTKISEINGQRWVDALHLASEVPGFYTRYIATVKEDLGIAVTFSVAKQFYDAYQDVFDKVIASMRVFRQKQVDLDKVRQAGTDNSIDSVTYVPDQMNPGDLGVNKNKGASVPTSSDDMTMYFLLAGVAVVGFIIIKNKNKNKKKK